MGGWVLPAGQGLAALWQANVIPATEAEVARYAPLVALARPYLARVWRPPPPVLLPPPQWMVAAVTTGLRPTYTLNGTTPVREPGKFVPTLTNGRPTPCTCAGDGNSAMLGTTKICSVDGYRTSTDAARLTNCIPVAP